MKRLFLLFLVLFFSLASIAHAETGRVNVTDIVGTTFVIVKDMGANSSAVELFKIVDGKIYLIDAYFIWEEPLNKAVKYKRFEIKEKEIY